MNTSLLAWPCLIPGMTSYYYTVVPTAAMADDDDPRCTHTDYVSDNITPADMSWHVQTTYVDCPSCNGEGVHYFEPGGWWHGSHVYMQEMTCTTCDGTGDTWPAHVADATVADDYADYECPCEHCI